MVEDKGETVEVRPAARSDIPSVVAIHRRAFPGFNTTRLGRRFLGRYYQTLHDHPSSIFLVAEHLGSLIGFAAGTFEPASFYQALRRRRVRLGLAMLPGLLANPTLFASVFGSSRWAAGQARSSSSGECELTSIATDPGSAGRGVGTALVHHFAAAATRRGTRWLVLTTDEVDNDPTLAFYDKLGFEVHRRLKRDRPLLELRLDLGGGDR